MPQDSFAKHSLRCFHTCPCKQRGYKIPGNQVKVNSLGLVFVSLKKDQGNLISVVVMLASVDLVFVSLFICEIENAIHGVLFSF